MSFFLIQSVYDKVVWDAFSQLGFHLWEGAGGSVLSGTTGGVSTDSFISGILSTCKTENRL